MRVCPGTKRLAGPSRRDNSTRRARRVHLGGPVCGDAGGPQVRPQNRRGHGYVECDRPPELAAMSSYMCGRAVKGAW